MLIARSPFVLVLALLAVGMLHNDTIAQGPPPYGDALVLRIKHLDSAKRDAVVADLQAQGGMRVSYACVPAGILVLAPTAQNGNTTLRASAMPLLQQHVHTRDVTELDITMAEAEELCAQARNR